MSKDHSSPPAVVGSVAIVVGRAPKRIVVVWGEHPIALILLTIVLTIVGVLEQNLERVHIVAGLGSCIALVHGDSGVEISPAAILLIGS